MFGNDTMNKLGNHDLARLVCENEALKAMTKVHARAHALMNELILQNQKALKQELADVKYQMRMFKEF